ncbi:hypothetical protein MCERHM31_00795 [Methylophilaceae bacterium]
MSKINIGKMPCETCGNHVTVKQNENGTLSYRCDECDAAPYAKTGTLQNEHWRSKLVGLSKVDAEAGATTDLKQAANTTPAPAKNKAVGIFGEL